MIPFPFQAAGAGIVQQPASGGGGGGDPYWANVTSLLHFNGVDGSTTFTDEKGLVWTPQGGAEIDTAQSVFGGASFLLNNSYLRAATAGNFDFGTGDFTVECRIRCTNFSGSPNIFSNRSGGGSEGVTFRVSTAGKLMFFWGAGTNLISSSATLSLNTWYAVRLTRVGTTVYIFVDGNLEASVSVGTSNLTASASTLTYIGRYGAASAEQFSGWIDEFRVTKGVGRSAASYTLDGTEFPNS